jgi:hypothetical protein
MYIFKSVKLAACRGQLAGGAGRKGTLRLPNPAGLFGWNTTWAVSFNAGAASTWWVRAIMRRIMFWMVVMMIIMLILMLLMMMVPVMDGDDDADAAAADDDDDDPFCNAVMLVVITVENRSTM